MKERFNRIIRDELLSNKDLLNSINTRGNFNLVLQEFINNYNSNRPHSALDFKSPMNYYKEEKEKMFLSQTG